MTKIIAGIILIAGLGWDFHLVLPYPPIPLRPDQVTRIERRIEQRAHATHISSKVAR